MLRQLVDRHLIVDSPAIVIGGTILQEEAGWTARGKVRSAYGVSLEDASGRLLFGRREDGVG